MERRILLMLLALLIIFAFAACDEEKPTDNMDWIWVGTSSKHGALDNKNPPG